MTLFRHLHSIGFSFRRMAASVLILSLAIFQRPEFLPAKSSIIRLAGDEWFLSSLTKTGTIAGFEQETGIHVEVLFENDRTIMSHLDQASSAENDALDLIVVRHRLLGTLVQKGQVRAIDDFLADPGLHDPSFVPQKQLFTNWWSELSTYGDHIYGYPFTGLTTFLCYRKDLLDDSVNRGNFQARYHRALSVPRTWQEYNEVAEFFTRPGDHLYGTYVQGKQALALWYEWLNLAYSFGGNILDSNKGWEYGDIVVNCPQNVAATAEYMELIPFSPPETLSYGWNEAQSALQQAKVFMGLLWDDQASFLEDPKVSKVAAKIGYALVPSDSGHPFSQLEGLTYLIPAESKRPREAYKFLEFAMSTPAQVELTVKGGTSLRRSTYDDRNVKQIPYVSTFLAAVDVAKGKPTIPQSPKMTDAMVQRLSEIVSGKNTPKVGLDQLAVDLRAILGEKSRLRCPPELAAER